MQSFLARWGFVIAGAVFLLATLVPLVTDRALNVPFFVLAMVFLVIGSKSAGRRPPKQ